MDDGGLNSCFVAQSVAPRRQTRKVTMEHELFWLADMVALMGGIGGDRYPVITQARRGVSRTRQQDLIRTLSSCPGRHLLARVPQRRDTDRMNVPVSSSHEPTRSDNGNHHSLSVVAISRKSNASPEDLQRSVN